MAALDSFALRTCAYLTIEMYIGFTGFKNSTWVSLHKIPVLKDVQGHPIRWRQVALIDADTSHAFESELNSIILEHVPFEAVHKVKQPFMYKSAAVLRNYLKLLVSLRERCFEKVRTEYDLERKVDEVVIALLYCNIASKNIGLVRKESSWEDMQAQLLRISTTQNNLCTEDIEDSDNCCICFSSPKTQVMVPCGHKCICVACDTLMHDRKCPICRAHVVFSCRVYE